MVELYPGMYFSQSDGVLYGVHYLLSVLCGGLVQRIAGVFASVWGPRRTRPQKTPVVYTSYIANKIEPHTVCGNKYRTKYRMPLFIHTFKALLEGAMAVVVNTFYTRERTQFSRSSIAQTTFDRLGRSPRPWEQEPSQITPPMAWLQNTYLIRQL